MFSSSSSFLFCFLTFRVSFISCSYPDFQLGDLLQEEDNPCRYSYQWWRIAGRNDDIPIKHYETRHCVKYGQQLMNIQQFNRMSRLLKFSSQFRTIYLEDEVAGKVMLVNILPNQESKLTFTVDLYDEDRTPRTLQPPPSHFVCVAVECITQTKSTVTTIGTTHSSTILVQTHSTDSTTTDLTSTTTNTEITAMSPASFITSQTLKPLGIVDNPVWRNWTVFVFLICCSLFVILLVLIILILTCRLTASHRAIRHHKETIDYLSTIKRPQASNGNIDRRRNLLNTQRSASISINRQSPQPLIISPGRTYVRNSPKLEGNRTVRLVSLYEVSPTSTSTMNISAKGSP